MNAHYPISRNLIGRLSFYRRLLGRFVEDDPERAHIFSHELASLAGYTPALVRRDIMTIGFSGHPRRGYGIAELISAIGRFLDIAAPRRAGLAGVGNLGRALLAYFAGSQSRVPIVAAFDVDPSLVGVSFSNCRCYDVAEIGRVVRREEIRVAVLAVPPGVAQATAERFTRAGVLGILNFTPVFITAGDGVYVHNIDLTMSLEQVAYFAR